jgi:predicted kinase
MTLPGSPRLIAVGGLSGVGKSTLARAIGGCVGLPPGARILRSDVLRKRMNGVEADVRLPADCYTPQANREVYAEMRRLAANALSGGIARSWTPLSWNRKSGPGQAHLR